MAKSERQKLKLLILRDYLRSHTDEQHPVSMQQILAALEGEGIRAERKSVYDDLDTPARLRHGNSQGQRQKRRLLCAGA